MISNSLVRKDEASNITGRMQGLSPLQELRDRNNQRVEDVIRNMGDKWVLHQSNRVHKTA